MKAESIADSKNVKIKTDGSSSDNEWSKNCITTLNLGRSKAPVVIGY
jgi:hypothetical protein